LARLAAANFYEPPGLLHHLYLNGLPDTKIERAHHTLTFARLATLTRLAPLALYGATVHTFAPAINLPGHAESYIDLPGGETGLLLDSGIGRKQVRTAMTALFCPLCLQEAPYHRLAWLPFAVSACLSHQCLLLDRCPACRRTVSIWDVVYTRCHHCQAELTQAPVLSLAHDDEGLLAQRMIQAWLTGDASLVAGAGCGLPEAPPRALYRVLDGLRASTMRVQVEWAHFHRLVCPDQIFSLQPGRRSRATALESYLRYTTAAKALMNWPYSFYAFLRAFANRPGRSQKSGLAPTFNTIQNIWLRSHWNRPEFQFVQEAFEQYLMDTYPLSSGMHKVLRTRQKTDLAGNWEKISFTEAARLIGVAPALIARQVEWGRLSVVEIPNQYSPPRFVRRQEVLTWGQRLREAISLRQAMEQLGVPEGLVVKLAKMNHLEVIRGPHIDGSRRWKLSRSSVINYRQQLIRQVMIPSSPAAASFDLARAIDLLIYVGLDTLQLFERVATGRLPAYHLQPEQARLADLRFAETDIRACVEAVKGEKGWMSRQDIVGEMGLARKESLSEWIAVGFLAPVAVHAQVQYFDRTTVEAFIRDHVTVRQAAEMLDQQYRARIYDLITEGLLKPVSGPAIDGCFRYLLRRTEVERLQKLMTLSQMAHHLGLNCAQALQQVRQGQLLPVSGPDIDDSPHYFFDRPPELAGRSSEKSQ
jgi:hypothetical protein